MSDLDDFLGAAFDDAAAIIGTVSFSISGVVATFTGIIDRTQKQESMPEEGGGFLPAADATIVAKASQFASVPDVNLDLTVGSQVFHILRIESDTIALTFFLAHPASAE